ncbi:MAG: response regulator [Lachnospiraceae bacterium]|nr:response regulator [Lachnospiraceae bacterium]
MSAVLLIREERTFMVNALASNLLDSGFEVREVSFDVEEIGKYQESSNLLVLYADETISENQSVLVFLKDLCVEKDKMLVFIGNKPEMEDISPFIPSHLFTEIFERPLDMNHFVERINAMTSETEIDQRKKSILLVDDDVGFMHILKEWLKDDYKVGMAKSGMQAITWLSRNHVDLILLDYDMPVANGLKVFEMLKSEQFSKDIPVMFLTGRNDRETIMRVMLLKPAGYMLKNATKVQILSNLDKFFVKQKYSQLSKN